MGALRLTLIAVFSIFRYSKAVDTIGLNQVVRDGETLISAGGSFELGFFSPGNSKNQYLGIWFKKASSLTVVWVANRGIPVTDSSGVLKVTDQGTLVVLNGNDTILWSSNSSRSARNTTAQLLETGNLVVKDGDDDNPENFLWQSFDYPCNTLLPGMKFGKNRVTGLDQYLSAWKSSDDPSEGDFTYRLDPGGYPQLLLWQGSSVKFRTGPLNGVRFSGFPEMEHHSVYPYEFVSNEQELYFSYVPVNGSIISLVLNPQGSLGAIIWIDRITNDWNMYSSIPKDECDFYGLCGVYGSCNISRSPKCECMKGFVPKFQEDWDQADWSNGCVRSTPLDCPNGDGFEKFSAVKLPDTRNSWFNRSMSFNECEAMCLSNCSCSAYAYFDIRDGGSGCLFWFDDLIDITSLTGNEQEIYVRMAAAEVGTHLCLKKYF